MFNRIFCNLPLDNHCRLPWPRASLWSECVLYRTDVPCDSAPLPSSIDVASTIKSIAPFETIQLFVHNKHRSCHEAQNVQWSCLCYVLAGYKVMATICGLRSLMRVANIFEDHDNALLYVHPTVQSSCSTRSHNGAICAIR